MKTELAKARMRLHKLASIRADVIACGALNGEVLDSRVFLSISDNEGGTAVCAIPDDNISDLARAALQLTQMRAAPGATGNSVPRVTAINDVSQWTDGLRDGQVALEFCIGPSSIALVFDRAALQSALLAGLMASKGKAQ